jgi:hypothetical protein
MQFTELLNKKVRVRVPGRNETGMVDAKLSSYSVGICKFAGWNPYLEVWQITVGRTPIFPIQFKDVEIIN